MEQAKGVLAERLGVSPDEAFVHLRQMARSARSDLSATATRIVGTSVLRHEKGVDSVSQSGSDHTGEHGITI